MGFRVFYVILLASIPGVICSSRSSETIKFENGQYTELTIAVDGNKIGVSECANIVNTLKEVIPEFSSSLFQATEGKARLGKVNVLLPANWTYLSCGFSQSSDISTAPPNLCYDIAHIQLTQNHPLASTLPWTRQYKPCGQEGDSIVIPLSFLLSNLTSPIHFSSKIKGHLLLHEWTKFRYGAFDEIGYTDEAGDISKNSFRLCYENLNQADLTSCTGKRLPSVALNTSACTVDFLEKQETFLMGKLKQSNSSVMSFPQVDNLAHYCTKSDHNKWATTKQNMYCKRSVGEVVNSHADFSSNAQTQFQNVPPQIEFMKYKRNYPYESAYAIIVDDTPEMRDGYKILHVKQAIAEFVKMLELGTAVHLTVFSHSESANFSTFLELRTEEDKKTLLEYIPDLDAHLMADYSRTLLPVIDNVLTSLATLETYHWNVVIFSDATVSVEDMSATIDKFEREPHSVSVITFESDSASASEDWLDWYRIPNTKNVMVLPYCTSASIAAPCSVETSIFIIDHLLGLLNEQQVNARQIQKVAQVVISNSPGQTVTFNLEGSTAKNFYFYFPLPQKLDDVSDLIKLIPPTGSCTTEPLLNYGGVVTFGGNECRFQSGQWSLRIEKEIIPRLSRLHLEVFAENQDSERLVVTSSLGQTELTKGIMPNSKNLTTIFVHLTTPEGNPVLDSEVTLKIFYPILFSSGRGHLHPKEIVLRDDGNSNGGADQTANDGIYSGYLTGYSATTPSYHVTRVNVQTSARTRVLETIESPNASLLSRELRNKCCGKIIRPSKARSLRSLTKFQTLHLGFKTTQPYTETSAQPETIGNIQKLEETETTLSIQFPAIRGDVLDDSIRVASIHACCIPLNGADLSANPPEETDCKGETTQCDAFVSPGAQQTCRIDKATLVRLFVRSREDKITTLNCALRAYNTNSEPGEVSTARFDVTLSQDIIDGDNEPTCDRISDGCLPILIFWIMIGCIALLVGVVILLLIVWWCTSRRRKERPRHRSPSPPPVYVPKGKKESVARQPIKDDESPVNYTTVTCEPRNGNVRKPSVEEPKVVKELFVNHAYIQNDDGELKIIADDGKILRKPLNTFPKPNEPVQSYTPLQRPFPREIPITENMQIFKPEPYAKPVQPSYQREMPRLPTYQPQRPQIVHQNPMLRSDSQLQIQEVPVPVATARSNIPTNPYATVSRVGRRQANEVESPNKVSSPKQVTFNNSHYMTPQSTTMPVRNGRLQRGPIPSFQPQEPPPVHPYPSTSSDSDTTSEDEVVRPPRFAKPPTYPAGSQIVNRNVQNPPRTLSRQPPSISSAGSPPVLPPVPPPRYTGAVAVQKPSNNPPVPTFPSRQITVDDDDSDEWDDGDGEYNMGVSYA